MVMVVTYLILCAHLFGLEMIQLILDVLLLDVHHLELVLKFFHLQVEVFFLFFGLLGSGLFGYTVNFHLSLTSSSFEFNKQGAINQKIES